MGKLQTRSLLCVRFTNAEIESLESQPRFVTAMKTTKTTESFERLCETAEELLKVKAHANPVARQFRQSYKQNPPSPTPLRLSGEAKVFLG